MKPLINLDELGEYVTESNGRFGERYAGVSDKIGAQKLGYSVSVVAPGKMVCPFHNHRSNEEMFLILEGTGTLRFGDQEYPLRANDVIACPPGGQEVAHQIINTGNVDLRYFCLSTAEPVDICEYPDSGKVLSYVRGSEEPGESGFRHISRLAESVDYFDGET